MSCKFSKLLFMDLHRQLHLHKKSLTRARAEIWRILHQSGEPLAPREIYCRLLEKCRADLATVYRNLYALKEAGLVQEVDLREASRRWEAVIPGEHTHHITCQGCGRIEKLPYCAFEGMIEMVQKNMGYLLKDHYLECFGICPECQDEVKSSKITGESP